MLQLKPTCEHCGKKLPPDSDEALICSYECTFCADCVEGLLANVCPNCGGGFMPRPIRPHREWREGVSLTHQPATTEVTEKKIDFREHAKFAAGLKGIPAGHR